MANHYSRFRTLLVFFLLTPGSLFGQNLVSRYQKISCAVVPVAFDGGAGTAFFVNSTGRLVTVAHVLYDRKYEISGQSVKASVSPRVGLKIVVAGVLIPLNIPGSTPEDERKALFDLALVETGLKSPCYIPLGDSDAVKVGEHLISIGYPDGATSGVLYDRFLSSRAARFRLPFGPIEGHPDLSYTPNYEVIRVQMPITPGTSGSPIISDSNEVVGVISEVPVILTKEIQRISEAYGGLKNTGSGITLSGFDTTRILGELAWVVSEFESPGAGLAVPISNLDDLATKPKQTTHPK